MGVMDVTWFAQVCEAEKHAQEAQEMLDLVDPGDLTKDQELAFAQASALTSIAYTLLSMNERRK